MTLYTLNAANLPLDSLNKTQGHKFDHGHAFVLSGGVGKTGAARLSARAALRIGAGLVTIGAPPAALCEVAAQISALMVRSIKTPEDMHSALSDKRITALCLGPGFGVAPAQAALIECVLRARRPTVVDADAITLLAADPRLRKLLHSGCVLTPHGGEFARLFPDRRFDADGAALDQRAAATIKAAQELGCVVVAKGENTLIANPNGEVCLHQAVDARAAPWLATAGSGDVLAGFITGLLARGLTPFEAAQTAVWIHVECAIDFGPGLIAEDLPDTLPRVLRRLLV